MQKYFLSLCTVLAMAVPLAGTTYCPAGSFQAACKKILVIHTDGRAQYTIDEVQKNLIGTSSFEVVDTIIIGDLYQTVMGDEAGILRKLRAYDAILVYSDWGKGFWSDRFGDNLASYHDAGGGVVVSYMANTAMFGLNSERTGAWVNNGYALLDYGIPWINNEDSCLNNDFERKYRFALQHDSLGYLVEPKSPLLQGVSSLDVDQGCRNIGAIINDGITVAMWRNNGDPLVIRGKRGNRTLVELNMYPVSRRTCTHPMCWTGDGTELIRNALKYSRCMLCWPGTYSTAIGSNSSAECKPCEQKTLSLQPYGSTSCVNFNACDPGSYAETSAGICAPCSSGTYSTASGALSQETCIPCPAGTFSPAIGSSDPHKCIPCLSGRYWTGQGANSSAVCCGCNTGTYSSQIGATHSSACIQCHQGTFSGESGRSYCDFCGRGTFASMLGTSACSMCGPGTYSNIWGGTSSCTHCEPMSFSEASYGSTSCVTACDTSSYAAVLMGDEGKAAAQTLGVCTKCTLGMYSSAVGATSSATCSLCMAGRYGLQSLTGASTGSCQCCNSGKYSSGLGQTSCDFCEAGTFSRWCQSSCDICPRGQFSSSIGSAWCDSCTLGDFSTMPGSSSCLPCGKGNYSISSDCLWCPPGTFSTAKSHFYCTPCAQGTFSTAQGATSSATCIHCQQGKYTPYREPYSATGYSTCGDCSAGTFGSDGGLCVLCSPGTYSTTIGANSSVACVACNEETFSYAGSSICYQCPRGKYLNKSKNSCISCGRGFNPGFLRSNLSNPSCKACAPGKYYDYGGDDYWGYSDCFSCWQNTYSSQEAAVSCTGCAFGTYSSMIAASTPSVCVTCDRGKYLYGNCVADCPPGTYGFVLSPCPALSSDLCGVGTVCTPCWSGSYCNTSGATSSASCLPCPAGKYSSVYNPWGFYWLLADRCYDCAKGSYSNSTGMSSCSLCPTGTYSTFQGASTSAACSLCATGTYSTKQGGTVCFNCWLGSFFSGLGATSHRMCESCNPGTYSTILGANSAATCIMCGVGTYSTASGETLCSISRACLSCRLH